MDLEALPVAVAAIARPAAPAAAPQAAGRLRNKGRCRVSGKGDVGGW